MSNKPNVSRRPTFESIYANQSQLRMSATEFRFCFHAIRDNNTEELVEIIMAPENAKVFNHGLAQLISQFEGVHGRMRWQTPEESQQWPSH